MFPDRIGMTRHDAVVHSDPCPCGDKLYKQWAIRPTDYKYQLFVKTYVAHLQRHVVVVNITQVMRRLYKANWRHSRLMEVHYAIFAYF